MKDPDQSTTGCAVSFVCLIKSSGRLRGMDREGIKRGRSKKKQARGAVVGLWPVMELYVKLSRSKLPA